MIQLPALLVAALLARAEASVPDSAGPPPTGEAPVAPVPAVKEVADKWGPVCGDKRTKREDFPRPAPLEEVKGWKLDNLGKLDKEFEKLATEGAKLKWGEKFPEGFWRYLDHRWKAGGVSDPKGRWGDAGTPDNARKAILKSTLRVYTNDALKVNELVYSYVKARELCGKDRTKDAASKLLSAAKRFFKRAQDIQDPQAANASNLRGQELGMGDASFQSFWFISPTLKGRLQAYDPKAGGLPQELVANMDQTVRKVNLWRDEQRYGPATGTRP